MGIFATTVKDQGQKVKEEHLNQKPGGISNLIAISDEVLPGDGSRGCGSIPVRGLLLRREGGARPPHLQELLPRRKRSRCI